MVNAPTRPTEEIARLGREIYQRDIRPVVEGDHHGEVVAIDVDTGDYAIGDSVIAAAADLRKKRPGAGNVPLIGMLLLGGHDLSVGVRNGGRVVIRTAE